MGGLAWRQAFCKQGEPLMYISLHIMDPDGECISESKLQPFLWLVIVVELLPYISLDLVVEKRQTVN